MKKRNIAFSTVLFVAALPMAMSGCDREISHSSRTTTKSDGSVKTEEKTVKKAPDGTIIKEETEKSKTPPNPP